MDSKIKKREKKISNLEDHLGFWLRFVSNQVSYSFSEKLAEAGFTVSEWVVLRSMLNNGNFTSPSQISETIGLTRGAITKLIDKLIVKGMVTRTESKEDRRYQILTLTTNAKQTILELSTMADLNDEEYFGHLTRSERNEFKKMLIKIVNVKNIRKLPIE